MVGCSVKPVFVALLCGVALGGKALCDSRGQLAAEHAASSVAMPGIRYFASYGAITEGFEKTFPMRRWWSVRKPRRCQQACFCRGVAGSPCSAGLRRSRLRGDVDGRMPRPKDEAHRWLGVLARGRGARKHGLRAGGRGWLRAFLPVRQGRPEEALLRHTDVCTDICRVAADLHPDGELLLDEPLKSIMCYGALTLGFHNALPHECNTLCHKTCQHRAIFSTQVDRGCEAMCGPQSSHVLEGINKWLHQDQDMHKFRAQQAYVGT